MKKITLTALTAALILVACKTKQPVTTEAKPKVSCPTPALTYAVDIKPILEQHCTRCHGRAGGYDLKNFDDVVRSAKNGSLVGTIRWGSGFPKMPAGAAQLDEATIAKIECWVNNGAKQ